MKILIAGGGDTGVELAKTLIKEKHDVILIEANKERAEYLAEKLDCLVISGDATDPNTLAEAGVSEADYVVVLTGEDRYNILVALLAKHLGAKNIIVKIENPIYNDLLYAHGLEHVVNPNRLIVSQVLDILKGTIKPLHSLPQTSMRLQLYEVTDKLDKKKISELGLDEKKAKILIVYRGDEAFFADKNTVLERGDKVLVAFKPDYSENIKRIFEE